MPRERTGHSKHPLPTAQEMTLRMDITRWSIPKSDWLYSSQPKMGKLYAVRKNKTGSWLWLRLCWVNKYFQMLYLLLDWPLKSLCNDHLYLLLQSVLKSILPDVNIATSAFFALYLYEMSFLHHFTFSMCVCLHLKWVSYRQQI